MVCNGPLWFSIKLYQNYENVILKKIESQRKVNGNI